MSNWKSVRRVLSILLVLAMLLSALPTVGASTDGAVSNDTVSTPTGSTLATNGRGQSASQEDSLMATSDTTVPYGPIALVNNGQFAFTLLSASEYSEMTLTFADAINKRTGAAVTVGDSSTLAVYEMIIGQYSARSDSATVYNAVANHRNDNASDYVIRLVGTKLYVAATTQYAMQNALDYFLDTYVKDDQGRVSAVLENGSLVEHRPHHYFWDTAADGSHVEFRLAGHKLSEYVIRTERYPSQLTQRSAIALQEFFMENYGVVLPIKPVNTDATNIGIYGPEFRIGPMNGAVNMIRPDYTSFTKDDWQEHITIESDGLIAGDYSYYEMTWDGDHIQLNGGSDYAISAATMRLIQVFEDQIKNRNVVMTPATTFTGNYQSVYDHLYGGGYDTVDFSLVDGFGLVYSDEFDYTGSDKKVYETVRSKWTLSQDMDYPTEGIKQTKENYSVFPDVYGENWWVAADTSGNNYLFEITKKHDKADETIGNTTYSFYEGVRLASQQKWGFRYGIWETRMVMGTHNGSSSAVWSHTREPYPQDTGYWHEIDVYENYGQDCFVPCLHSFDETMTSGYPHANEEDPENPLLMQGQFDEYIPSMDGTSTGGTNYQSESWEEPASGEHFYDTFHHVSIDWTYDYLRVYLDGEMVSRIILGEEGPTGDDGIYENLFDCYRAGQTIKLSNGVGGRYYSRTRPVGESLAAQPYTPDYFLGEAVSTFFEAQLVDYTRIYQTSNKDIHYEPAKNEMLFDERYEFNETSQNRYGQFTKAQSFESYDSNEVLSLGSDAIIATEEEHLAGFSSAKVTTTGNGLYRAPQLVLKNVFDRPFMVERGKNYDVVFYVKVPTTEADYNLDCWLSAADDTVGFGQKTVTVTEKGGWQKVEFAIRDCQADGDLRLYITGSTDAPHTFYLEDIYLHEIVNRPVDETAMNFESAEVGTVLMSNNGGDNGSSVVISDKNSYSGAQSALFTTDVHSVNQRAQMNVTDAAGNPVKLEQGKDYWLNFKLYIDKAYYSAVDVDANGSILTLKEAAFNFYAACVPDGDIDTYFSGSFPYSYKDADDVTQKPYAVYEEEGNLENAKSQPGTAKKEHQTRNEWIDVSVKIEDCAVSGNLRLGMSHYAQTQFYCYVDDIKVYEGAQNVTVKFDTNGGTGSYADQVAERGSTIAAVSEPTREHYIFRGWHTDKDFVDGSYFVFGETPILGYNGDTVTLYARWEGVEHAYDSACDEICNWCGGVRDAADHTYDNECDTTCNVCGAYRETTHWYDNICDNECNVCGTIRPIGGHEYDDACDAYCNKCYTERVAPHTYANACDVDCDACGATRTVGDHVYETACGTVCTECGATRETGHTYDDVCDSRCNVCDEFRNAPHAYSSKTDIDCDLCGMIRATGSTAASVLNGKTALFSGDSIAYGGGEEKEGLPRRSWALRMGDDYGMIVTNNGQSGYALSDVRKDMYIHSTLIEGNFEYVILEGGINDAMDSVEIGSIAETKDLADFDTTTFAGGLERYFYYATTMYPNARIGFIITYDVPASVHGGNTRTAAAYWDMARKICAKWDIAYLDLHTARISDELLQTSTGRYLPDGLHVNSAGYDLLTPYIANWMTTLKRYSDVGVHLDDGSIDMSGGGTSSYVHVYSNACDTDCNECGDVREVSHSYSGACDRICDLCTVKRAVSSEHTYDDANDVICNICGEEQVHTHDYDYACDSKCNTCGEVRSVSHTYANALDIDCDVCGLIRTVNSVTVGALANKTVVFMGDSITYGYGEAIENLPCRSWAQRIGNDYQMIVTNNGNNGHALSDVRPAKKLHEKFVEGAFDYVVLQGGINDAMDSVALGSIAETKNLADFDVNTFAGGLERYFYYATTMYPNARIGFIITYDVPASTWGGNTKDAIAYWELAREICAKWDIAYLDLSNVHYSDEILKTTTDECLIDTLHLNSNGYDVIAPYIAQWMATLKPYNTVGVHLDDGFVDMEGGGEAVVHIYENACDADCNFCGEVRVLTHTYAGDCDHTCDACGSKRVATGEHIYDDAADTECNVCGATRETNPHEYDGDCDSTCNICGEIRETSAAHTYDDACDTDCNVCGDVRVAPHKYDGDCDSVCNLCDHIRQTSALHTYDDVCDTDCNVCGNVRVAIHEYDGACDSTCNLCGEIREVSVDHTYDNACDADCNVCGDVRDVEHEYDGVCDSDCNVCGEIRDASADHIYDNACDTDCNVCGDVRDVEHEYDSACDSICNVCGAQRAVSADAHTASDWITDSVPTSLAPGRQHIECTVCSTLLKSRELLYSKENPIVLKEVTGKTFKQLTTTMIPAPIDATPYTIEAKIHVPKTNSARVGVIVGNYRKDAGNCLNLEIAARGKVRLYYIVDGVAQDTTFNTDIRSNTPVHLTVTIDGMVATLYVNGVAVETAALTVELRDVSGAFKVGGDNRVANYGYFTERIYSVSLFGDVRTPEEIRQDMMLVNDDGESVLYTGVYYDEEKADITKVIPMGKTFGGFGGKESVFIGKLEDPVHTMEAVVAVPKDMEGNVGVLVGNVDGKTGNQMNIEIVENGAPRLVYGTGTQLKSHTFNADVRSNGLTHIAMTMEGTTAKLYINGKLVESATLETAFPLVNEAMVLGADNTAAASTYFRGFVYSTHLFSNVRTAAQIAEDVVMVTAKAEGLIYSNYFITESKEGTKVEEKMYARSFTAATCVPVDALTTAPRTIEIILQLSKSYLDRAGTVLGNYDNSTNDQINVEIAAGGKVRLFYISATKRGDCVFSTDIRSDDPRHIAITVDGNIASLYVDGTLKEQKTLTVAYAENATNNFLIGGDNRKDNVWYFRGSVYAVSLFSDVRTAEEIKNDAQSIPTSGESQMYSKQFLMMDDSFIDTVKVMEGQRFNATNLVHIDTLPSAPRTIEATVQVSPTVTDRAGVIVGNYDGSTNDQINLEIYNAGKVRLFFVANGVKYNCIFNTDIRSDAARHIAVTVTDTGATLYVDGVEKETIALNGAYANAVTGFNIGGDNRMNNATFFLGSVYSVSLFSDVRTAEEIHSDSMFVACDTEDLMFCQNFAVVNEQMFTADDGRYFDAKNYATVDKELTTVPSTIEVTLQVPTKMETRAGVVLGNYASDTDKVFTVEIYTFGRVRLFFMSGGVKCDVMFSTDIRSDVPLNVAITIDGRSVTLYVDGVAKETKEMNIDFDVDLNDIRIGGDNRTNNIYYFKGKIYSVNMFDDVRTAKEIRQDMLSVAPDTEGLMYSVYYLTKECEMNPYDGKHVLSDWIVDIPSTETHKGIKHKECIYCGNTLVVSDLCKLVYGDVVDHTK